MSPPPRQTPSAASPSVTSDAPALTNTDADLPASSATLIDQLRQQMQACQFNHHQTNHLPTPGETLTSHCRVFDRLVSHADETGTDGQPIGGFQSGQLIEWLSEGPGSGAESLSLAVAREVAVQRNGALVLIDPDQTFYPPAAASWGIDFRRLLIVHPENHADALWAMNQALRCPSVAVVWMSTLSANLSANKSNSKFHSIDDRNFRRLQLSVEEGGGLGFLLRSARVRGKPTWSDMQLLVQPLPTTNTTKPTKPITTRHSHRRRWQIEMVRCRGRGHHHRPPVTVQLNHTTGRIESAVESAVESPLVQPVDVQSSIIRHSPPSPSAPASRHETTAVHLAAELAGPTTGHRTA